MKGCLLIWYLVSLAIASDEVLLRRADKKRPGSPLAQIPSRQRTSSPLAQNLGRQHSASPSGSGLSLARSSSSDSFDLTSIKTRVDGPGYVNPNKAPFELKVGKMAQMTHKAWDNDQLSSRTSLGRTRSQSARQAQIIAKGTSVKAHMDTTRGGHGYIRTKGRDGYHKTTVNPGERVSISAATGGNVRAQLKAKLNGGGILKVGGVYRDDSKSPSLSTIASSGLARIDSASVDSVHSGSSSNGKSQSGDSKDNSRNLSSEHPGHKSRGNAGTDQSGNFVDGHSEGRSGSKPPSDDKLDGSSDGGKSGASSPTD